MPNVIEFQVNQPATPEQEAEMWMLLYDITARSQSVVDMLQEGIKDCCLIIRRLRTYSDGMIRIIHFGC